LKILLFSPAAVGGIAEHAHYQARAIAGPKDESISEVVMLCSGEFLNGRKVEYEKAKVFISQVSVFSRIAGRVGGLIDQSLKMIGDQWRLAWEVIRRRPDVVLLASYSEYLSPFWAWPHWILSKAFGVIYVANLHDPVRDYVIGPKWWHNLSVRMAYWPISVGVVHQRLPEPSPVPSHVRVVEAPVGVYDLQEAAVDPEAIRAGWGVAGRNSEKLKEDLTTIEHGGRCEKEQSNVGPKGEGVVTSESKDTEHTEKGKDLSHGGTGNTEKTSGLRPGFRAGAAFSNPFTSELARDSENTSPTRFASIPASALDAGLSTFESKAPAASYSQHATLSSPEVVFLAFGFIRDNKNLDLVIRALPENPRAFLVVMGKAQSRKDKPVDFYRNLALELGVGDRVRFFDEFVPDEKLSSYFAAADVVVLTYDKTFHSQSGVLNVAARARRRVLASAGESPLKDCVQKFKLGVFVEPDDLDALKIGMKMVASDGWHVASGEPDWEGYENFASWDVNIAKILEAVEDIRQTKLKCSKRK
jgi:glycosyltransferase involved in cell wall biosynthesis